MVPAVVVPKGNPHDVREDDRFGVLNNLGDISIKLVKTKKHDL